MPAVEKGRLSDAVTVKVSKAVLMAIEVFDGYELVVEYQASRKNVIAPGLPHDGSSFGKSCDRQFAMRDQAARLLMKMKAEAACIVDAQGPAKLERLQAHTDNRVADGQKQELVGPQCGMLMNAGCPSSGAEYCQWLAVEEQAVNGDRAGSRCQELGERIRANVVSRTKCVGRLVHYRYLTIGRCDVHMESGQRRLNISDQGFFIPCVLAVDRANRLRSPDESPTRITSKTAQPV